MSQPTGFAIPVLCEEHGNDDFTVGSVLQRRSGDRGLVFLVRRGPAMFASEMSDTFSQIIGGGGASQDMGHDGLGFVPNHDAKPAK